MNIQPTEDRIYILPDKRPGAPSMGGIGSANFDGMTCSPGNQAGEDRPNTGRIVACGPGKMHPDYKGEAQQPMPYRRGQRVAFGAYSGDKVVLGSSTYLVIRARDVTAVLGGPKLSRNRK